MFCIVSCSAYFLAKSTADALFQLIMPILFSLTMYWLVGLQNTAEKFFIFMVSAGWSDVCVCVCVCVCVRGLMCPRPDDTKPSRVATSRAVSVHACCQCTLQAVCKGMYVSSCPCVTYRVS